MTRQELNRIIESEQPITINAELMAAARENAHQQRSESIRQGFTMVRKTLSEFRQAAWHRIKRIPRDCDNCSASVTS